MIPFVDLKAQYRSIKDEIDAAVLGLLESAQFVLGPEVRAFEEAFAPYCGAAHAAAVNSGTSALHLALLAAGVGPGDEVVVPAMTFVATSAAVLYAGARPAFAEVDDRTWTLDPAKLEAAITPRTKAILPVHLHGRCADMDPILEIARARGLPVIEDAAQAHGAEYKGRRAGSMGALGCFSFYPGKNLGAYGEGGAVVTSDAGLDRTVRLLRDWGAEKKYVHTLKGFNYRMEGLQGAILKVKMKHIEAWTEGRRRNGALYDRLLSGAPGILGLPDGGATEPGLRHVYHVYAVRVANRDRVQRALTEAGVSSGIHYPIPVHLQPAYAEFGYKAGDFPVAERLGDEFLSLPMFPELTADQIETASRALRAAVA